ncbi:hypothetical protein DL766_000738 [Monosporascus sp. MC13-8B]|nr:hypothetical protein DL763_002575 [Monosporascus cannonballus]RYP38929.1 hypothetical protein DL766_000738 [Monosporascus sp. MC13-8B]
MRYDFLFSSATTVKMGRGAYFRYAANVNLGAGGAAGGSGGDDKNNNNNSNNGVKARNLRRALERVEQQQGEGEGEQQPPPPPPSPPPPSGSMDTSG